MMGDNQHPIIIDMPIFAFLFLLLFTSCETSYLSVDKEFVDKGTLASTFVKSPDPAQETPPNGVRLWVSWNYPLSLWQKGSILYLKVVYGNYERGVFSYPIDFHKGEVSFEWLNQDYEEKGGLLTYFAEVVTPSGETLSLWKHQMWFELITP